MVRLAGKAAVFRRAGEIAGNNQPPMRRTTRSRTGSADPNMNLGAYDIHMALAEFPPPEWPEMPFMNVLEIAFKGRVIGSHDHPVIKRLRGLQ